MALPNLLSLNFLVPFVAAKIDFSRAVRGLRGMPRRVLLLGHKLAAGTAASNTVMTISTEADALTKFGEGSMLTQMWRAAKAGADLGLPIDCMVIDTGAGATAATSTVVVATAGAGPNAAGEVMLYIGGSRISVGVSQADTPAVIAARLTAAINANVRLPVTASNVAASANIVITARTPGPNGNDIDLRSTHYPDDVLASGVTLTIPVMAGGAVNPNLSAAIAALGVYRPTEIVCPFTDSANMLLLEAEMDTRWRANNMRDGSVIVSLRGTEATLTTWLNTRNSPHVHAICTTKDCENPWETAAAAGAVIESMANTDPAMPQTGALVPGYIGPRPGDHWTIDQMNNLLQAGGSPLTVAPDGTGALLRVVTNYKRTGSGAPDRSMAELCWLKTMSYYRWFVVTEFLTKYQGYKLAQYITEAIPGQKIMTAELGQEIMVGIYKKLMDAALVQNADYYKATLVVEVDGPNGKLKIQDEPVILTQHYQTEVSSYVVAGQV